MPELDGFATLREIGDHRDEFGGMDAVIAKAARELGMHRNTLSRTISELKIDMRQLRAGVKRPPRSARPSVYDKKIFR